MPDIFKAQDSKESKPKLSKPVSKPQKKDEIDLSSTPFKKQKSQKVHPLTAFCYLPKNVDFVTKEEEEKVVLLLRRHPVTNLGWLAVTVLMVMAPVVLKSFPILDFMPDRFALMAVAGWYLITAGFILQNFLSWFFNVNIITDERIIDIDFVNLIYREITEATIDNIQDVTSRLGSVVRTLFNYGDVIVQTASEVPNLEFYAVPQPDKVVKILRKLQVEEEQEKIEGRVR